MIVDAKKFVELTKSLKLPNDAIFALAQAIHEAPVALHPDFPKYKVYVMHEFGTSNIQVAVFTRIPDKVEDDLVYTDLYDLLKLYSH